MVSSETIALTLQNFTFYKVDWLTCMSSEVSHESI